jgi:hypothetical protein
MGTALPFAAAFCFYLAIVSGVLPPQESGVAAEPLMRGAAARHPAWAHQNAPPRAEFTLKRMCTLGVYYTVSLDPPMLGTTLSRLTGREIPVALMTGQHGQYGFEWAGISVLVAVGAGSFMLIDGASRSRMEQPVRLIAGVVGLALSFFALQAAARSKMPSYLR